MKVEEQSGRAARRHAGARHGGRPRRGGQDSGGRGAHPDQRARPRSQPRRQDSAWRFRRLVRILWSTPEPSGWVAVHAYTLREAAGRQESGGHCGGRCGSRLPPIARSHSGSPVRRPLGRRRRARGRGDPGSQPISRSGPGPGTPGHQALPPALAGQDVHPERHRANRHRAALGRGCPNDRIAGAISWRAAPDRDSREGRCSPHDAYHPSGPRPAGERSTRPIPISSPGPPAVRCAPVSGRLSPALEGGTALLDFSSVGLVDFSCADEVVAQLLLENTDECSSCWADCARITAKRSTTCSTHHALAVVVQESPDGCPRVLGPGGPRGPGSLRTTSRDTEPRMPRRWAAPGLGCGAGSGRALDALVRLRLVRQEGLHVRSALRFRETPLRPVDAGHSRRPASPPLTGLLSFRP